MVETALHHDPVDGAGQVDVRRQEDDVLALQRGYGLVNLHQVRHDLLEAALPFATGSRAGARIRSVLAGLLVVGLLRVEEGEGAAGGLISAGKHDRRRHLLHGQVPDVATQLASTCRTAGKLGSA